jgi:hypothetical protein
MSVFCSPNFVANGLVLCLDGANLRSWPGAGTTWYDVSGQYNTATMFGSVPTSSDGGGCFDFATATGASSSVSTLGFTFTSNMIPTTGSFTLSCWVKNAPASVGQCGLFSNAGGANGYRFGVGLNAVYVLISGANSEGYSEPQLAFTSTLSASLWYNVVTIFDRVGTNSSGVPQWQLYLNGSYVTATNMVTPQTAATTTAAPGLVRSACCSVYTGKVAVMTAHNRALSANEISQNYIALSSRFGL